jgi:hypothetical protein
MHRTKSVGADSRQIGQAVSAPLPAVTGSTLREELM